MQVLPAIDLRGGKCVRLRQGDYQQETVFSEDPSGMARHWAREGAAWLHVVDLDGAREGRVVNVATIEAIVRAVSLSCELGGGLREEAAIAWALGLGVRRVVLGSRALREADWLRAMCERFPGRLALGLDARDGKIAVEGWQQTLEARAVELARRVDDLPLAAMIYTDVGRDGMLAGPNLAGIAELVKSVRTPVIASGGITTADDIRRLAALGVSGCIIGRALYEGKLSLRQALDAAGSSEGAAASS